jgi:hypothetical protein
MKYILAFFFITTACFSQVKTYHDSILTEISLVDSTYITSVDTSHFFLPYSFLSEPDYQIFLSIISGRPDTLTVQQRRLWGRGANQDSAWVTVRVYNPNVSEVPDSILIVNSFVSEKSFYYTDALLWSPFIGDRWRIIRTYPTLDTPHRIYFTVFTRKWR